MPQQSHHKGKEREPGKGGTGPRETGVEGREERKGGVGEERRGGKAKRSGEQQGKRSDEGRCRVFGHLPQSRATTEMVRAAIMFSLLKYFLTYSAIIAMKLGHYIPEELKMMILCFSAGVIQN